MLFPLEGYRRLAYMMLDADVVAVSPSSVYRVLKAAGQLAGRRGKPSKKGQGFEQPLRPHEHWHIDISHINICGTFFFLCSILDGYSRFIIHWEIRETMTEAEVETILQRAREQFPGERPRIISDNGPQFIARDFKEFIRICGMTHVRTSPFIPKQRQDGAVVQDPERRVHSRQDAFELGGERVCSVTVCRVTLRVPGRRIRQRGDATERRPRGQDRCGRHDAAPGLTRIGPEAINLFTVLVPIR